ncbi:11323_t:CDS:1, partial [Scutellospora calospora]
RLHKEKRAQRNKPTTSPNLSFSTNNSYINKTKETVTDNNEPLTTEASTTTTCYQELSLVKPTTENLPLTSNNSEIQEQPLTTTSSFSTNMEIEKVNTDQDTVLIETNENNSADNNTSTTTTTKILKNKSNKKEQNHVKSSGPLRKRDLLSDNETKGGCHQEY